MWRANFKTTERKILNITSGPRSKEILTQNIENTSFLMINYYLKALRHQKPLLRKWQISFKLKKCIIHGLTRHYYPAYKKFQISVTGDRYTIGKQIYYTEIKMQLIKKHFKKGTMFLWRMA